MADLLTIKEAADKFHISERTLYKLVKEGKVSAVRIGSSLRIDGRSFLDSSSTTTVYNPTVLSETIAPEEAARILVNMEHEIKELKDSYMVQKEQLRRLGILNVLPPRRMSASTIGAVQEALRYAKGDVHLMGVALRAFMLQDGWCFDALRSKLQASDISVKALMLYPFGDAAKSRAIAEGADELAQLALDSGNQEEIQRALYKTDLFHNIIRSLWSAGNLRREFKEKFEVKLVDMHPTVWMVQTRDMMFVEIYHLGRSETDIPGRLIGGCVGELVPILAVAPQSNLYSLLDASFEHAWSGSNTFLRVRTFDEVENEVRNIRAVF